jgi:pimeloyl-ACP methyl ester carboxylesterase
LLHSFCASVAALLRSRNSSGGVDPAVARLGSGFASGMATVNGTSLYFVLGGSGPVVILLHGFPQDWYEWRKTMPLLAKTFTVVAVDLRGV